MPLQPLTFEPVFKHYTWGGRRLAELLGRAVPPGNVAESWEISAHPNGSTRVAAGALAGQSLARVQERLGEALVGRRNAAALRRGRFPLLIKLLDADDWLSVQVHPGDAYAGEHEDDLGKTEMWVVLQAEPGAEIIFGFEGAVDRSTLRAAIEEGTLERHLRRVPATAGDAFFVPAGTVHAIGPGLLLAEIQQSSDSTYRLYDWGRKPDGGPPRPLHIDKALDVAELETETAAPLEPVVREEQDCRVEELVRCPYFQTERITLAPGGRYGGTCSGETFEIWGALTGEVCLTCEYGMSQLAAVGWVLLPATLGRFEFSSAAAATFLRVVSPSQAA